MTTARDGHLNTGESWQLLEGHDMGRLVVVDADDWPQIFPVNYVVSEGAIYIRTAADLKLVSVTSRSDSVGAFEVDGGDDEERWSVVVRGPLTLLRDEVEIERSGVRRLSTWSPRFKPHVLKLSAQTVTGRRFVREQAAETNGRDAPPTPVPSFPPTSS